MIRIVIILKEKIWSILGGGKNAYRKIEKDNFQGTWKKLFLLKHQLAGVKKHASAFEHKHNPVHSAPREWVVKAKNKKKVFKKIFCGAFVSTPAGTSVRSTNNSWSISKKQVFQKQIIQKQCVS